MKIVEIDHLRLLCSAYQNIPNIRKSRSYITKIFNKCYDY